MHKKKDILKEQIKINNFNIATKLGKQGFNKV